MQSSNNLYQLRCEKFSFMLWGSIEELERHVVMKCTPHILQPPAPAGVVGQLAFILYQANTVWLCNKII